MSDSKISNKKYTVNTYEWTGEEIHFLGKYLEAQADILKTAGGRWATHGHGNKIEIPNLSVLATPGIRSPLGFWLVKLRS